MEPHKKHIWIDNAAARIVLYIAILAIGYLLIIYLYDAIRWLLPVKLYFKEILVSAIVIPLLILPFISICRFLKDKNSFMQSKQILDYRTSRTYSNARYLLTIRNDKHANAIGLIELVRLKQGGLVDPARIDGMTVTQDLSEAPLDRANLQGANLRETSLQEATLQDANLQEANLKWANLQGADLQGAKLHGADLQGANLLDVDLHGADLQKANLRGADLKGANLEGVNLEGVKNLEPGMLRKAKNWREARLDPTMRQQAEEADRADKEPG